jgi:hypothetical protein
MYTESKFFQDFTKIEFLAIRFSQYTVPLSIQALFKVQTCFNVFLILYAYFEHKPKSFYRSRRIRQIFLIIFGNCAKYR